jgi:hypothetical protein
MKNTAATTCRQAAEIRFIPVEIRLLRKLQITCGRACSCHRQFTRVNNEARAVHCVRPHPWTSCRVRTRRNPQIFTVVERCLVSAGCRHCVDHTRITNLETRACGRLPRSRKRRILRLHQVRHRSLAQTCASRCGAARRSSRAVVSPDNILYIIVTSRAVCRGPPPCFKANRTDIMENILHSRSRKKCQAISRFCLFGARAENNCLLLCAYF